MHWQPSRLLLLLLLLTAAGLPACGVLDPNEDQPSLTGTAWDLAVFQDPSGLRRTFRDDEHYTLAFADTTLGGRADCNQYAARYEAGDGTLRIRELITTEVACRSGSHYEDYYQALVRVSAYEVKDGRLRLGFAGAGGFGLLIYTPRVEITPLR